MLAGAERVVGYRLEQDRIQVGIYRQSGHVRRADQLGHDAQSSIDQHCPPGRRVLAMGECDQEIFTARRLHQDRSIIVSFAAPDRKPVEEDELDREEREALVDR